MISSLKATLLTGHSPVPQRGAIGTSGQVRIQESWTARAIIKLRVVPRILEFEIQNTSRGGPRVPKQTLRDRRCWRDGRI
jgi:hypothetical protein